MVIVSVTATNQMYSTQDDINEMQIFPISELSKASELLQRQRICMQQFIIGSSFNDYELIEDAYTRSESYRDDMQGTAAFDAY